MELTISTVISLFKFLFSVRNNTEFLSYVSMPKTNESSSQIDGTSC